jgi:hypothetical protein
MQTLEIADFRSIRQNPGMNLASPVDFPVTLNEATKAKLDAAVAETWLTVGAVDFCWRNYRIWLNR